MNLHKQLKILIVEAFTANPPIYPALLQQDTTCSYLFEQASCGQAGLQACRSFQPDCILLDFQLPDMDGVEFLRHLLDSTGSTTFPVVALTSEIVEEAALQAIQHGAQDYFVKSRLTAENLRRTVHYSVERYETNRKLRQAYVQVNNILESIMEGFVALDAERRFTYVNRPAEKMLRQSRQNLLQKTVWESFPELNTTDLPSFFQKFFFDDVTSRRMEIFYSPFQIWFDIQAYKAPNGETTVYFSDITARKQAEELLKNRERYQSATVELARRALTTPSFKDICFYAVQTIQRVVQAEVSLIFEYRRDDKNFVVLADNKTTAYNLALLPATPNFAPGYTFQTGETIYCTEGQNSRFAPLPFLNLTGYQPASSLTLLIPGGQNSQPYGVLGIYHSEARHYNKDEFQFLEGIASLLGLVRERLVTETALNKERELSELKSQFISMTSHEFRTPLSVILSSTELLELYYPQLSEESRNAHFQRVRTSIKHMTAMLSNVLLIGKAESGKLKFQPQMVDLVSFCQHLLNDFAANAEQHQLVFNTNVAGAPAEVDQHLIKQILTNLLSNAVNYSPAGSQVCLNLEYSPGKKVVFSVEDKGIGIPATEIPRLFEVFQRGSNISNVTGAGLGLAIVKRSVDLHQGTVEVKSTLEQGTTFTVTIPLSS